MPKVSGSMHAAPQVRGRVNSHFAATARKVGGSGGPVLLWILFWYIFYQNLPDNMGLNDLVTGEVAKSPDSLDRILKICMIAMAIYVMASRWSTTRALARYINVGAAAFFILTVLSVAWSIEPDATMLRFITLASIVFICFAISLVEWHPRRFQQLVLPPLMYIMIVSLVVGMMFPDRISEIGDDLSRKNAWHGVTLTKNQFGMLASIALIICVNRWLAREGRVFLTLAGAAAALACLLLSRSNTSMFATMLGVLFMVLVMRVPLIKRRYSTHLLVAIAATIILYELAIQNMIPGTYTLLAPIRDLTGKDASFSARTDIWDIIKEHIQWAPYLGTGYGAYWIGTYERSPSFVFTYRMFFYPTEAHNGYLDTVNDLGYVGLICLFVFLFSYMRQSLQLMRIDRSQAALYLALILQMMVVNMSESEWFSRDSAFTVVILAVTCLSRGLFEGRQFVQPAIARDRALKNPRHT